MTTVPLTATTAEQPIPVAAPVAPTVPEKFIKEGKPDYDALTKAYLELEKKQGTPPAPVTPPAAPPTPETPAPDAVPAGFAPYEQEFQKDGKLSDKSYTDLQAKTGMTKEDIDGYISYRKTSANSFEVEVLKDVGGKDGFAALSTWAAANLKPAEVDGVNRLLADVKNPETAKLALAGLKARMESKEGKTPSLIQGGVQVGAGGYQTMTDAMVALRDPRYRTDANFRAIHDQRMMASTFIETK